MKEIPLYKAIKRGPRPQYAQLDECALVDNEDFSLVETFRWSKHSRGYAIRYFYDTGRKRKVPRFLHQDILGFREGFEIDHANGIKLDCRRSNLRFLTHGDNLKNQRKHVVSSSKYKGVTREQHGWVTRLWSDRKRFYVGSFKNELHAALAYDIAAKDLHGELAVLNFPNGIHF